MLVIFFEFMSFSNLVLNKFIFIFMKNLVPNQHLSLTHNSTWFQNVLLPTHNSTWFQTKACLIHNSTWFQTKASIHATQYMVVVQNVCIWTVVEQLCEIQSVEQSVRVIAQFKCKGHFRLSWHMQCSRWRWLRDYCL